MRYLGIDIFRKAIDTDILLVSVFPLPKKTQICNALSHCADHQDRFQVLLQ